MGVSGRVQRGDTLEGLRDLRGELVTAQGRADRYLPICEIRFEPVNRSSIEPKVRQNRPSVDTEFQFNSKSPSFKRVVKGVQRGSRQSKASERSRKTATTCHFSFHDTAMYCRSAVSIERPGTKPC